MHGGAGGGLHVLRSARRMSFLDAMVYRRQWREGRGAGIDGGMQRRWARCEVGGECQSAEQSDSGEGGQCHTAASRRRRPISAAERRASAALEGAADNRCSTKATRRASIQGASAARTPLQVSCATWLDRWAASAGRPVHVSWGCRLDAKP